MVLNTIYNAMYIIFFGISILVLVRCMLELSVLLAYLQAWCDWIISGAAYLGIGSLACTLINLAAPIVSPVTSILYMLLSSHSPPAAVFATVAAQPLGILLDPTFGSAGLVGIRSVFGCANGANQGNGP